MCFYKQVDFPFRADHFTLETDPLLQRPKTSKLLRSFECYSPDSERWIPDSIIQFTHPMDCKHVPLAELDTFAGSELSQFTASADAAGRRLLNHFTQSMTRIKYVLSRVSDGSVTAGSAVDPKKFYSVVHSMLVYLDAAADESTNGKPNPYRTFSLVDELGSFHNSFQQQQRQQQREQLQVPQRSDERVLDVSANSNSSNERHLAEALRQVLLREEALKQQPIIGSTAVQRARFHMHALDVMYHKAFTWLQRRYTNRDWQLVAEINRAHERVSLKSRQHTTKHKPASSPSSEANLSRSLRRPEEAGPLRIERKPFAFFPGDIVRDRHTGGDGVVVSSYHWPGPSSEGTSEREEPYQVYKVRSGTGQVCARIYIHIYTYIHILVKKFVATWLMTCICALCIFCRYIL